MQRAVFRLIIIGVLVFSALLSFHTQVQAFVYPTFSNSAAITINDAPSGGTAAASPYPSTISVSGVVGSITNLTVTLNGLTHATVGDIDIVLVGPAGQASVLMSDVGGATAVSNITFTLDQAGVFLPSPPANGGVYAPRDGTSSLRCALDSYPSPAPSAPPTGLGIFNGLNGSSVNGTWSLYVVDDCTGNTGSLSSGWSMVITTDATAPLITSSTPPGGTVGTFYSHTYTASGSTPITFNVTSGSLPNGLTLAPGGLLSGTPTATGNFTGVVTASNGFAPNDTQGFNITIVSPPSITSSAPSNGTVGTFYSHTYAASGTTPITFSVTSGSLPDGLTLDPGGLLSGTPTASGNFTGVVTATNGIAPDTTQPFNITINPAAVAPSITSSAPPNGTLGSPYSHTYTASGDTPITFTVTSGSLPDGLTLDPGGSLSGTPTATGNFTGVVTATNGVSPDDTQPFNITIGTAPIAPVITSAAPPDGSLDEVYSHTYTATGNAPITFSVTSGSLPDGLTLTSGGLLSGTPTTEGNYTGVVTATNGVSPDDTQAFDITITATRPPDSGGEGHAYVPTAADHARAQAPLCADVSGKTSAIIRAVVNSGTVTDGSVFCRVLAENGSFLVDPAQIGSAQALAQPVSQAVDVFGLLHNGASQTHFNGPVQVCLQGSGSFLFLDATSSPRVLTQLPAWLDGGYTCASVPNAGTALLVQGAAPSASAPAGPGQALGSCMVTTLHIVNLRAGADVNSAILQMVPYNVTLTAFQHQGDWFNVDYLGAQGWVNAAFVAPNGACG